jgi:hypothetical protein
MAHLNKSTWTRSATYGRTLKKYAELTGLTIEEVMAKINQPERNGVFLALFDCTTEQLDRVERLCPLSKDLTVGIIEQAKREREP